MSGAAWKPAGLKIDIDGNVQDYPFTMGVQDIYLAHGQTAIILGLPEDTVNVSVREDTDNYYTVQSSLALSSETGFDSNDPYKDNDSEIAQTANQSTDDILNADAYVYYRNTLKATIPWDICSASLSSLYSS